MKFSEIYCILIACDYGKTATTLILFKIIWFTSLLHVDVACVCLEREPVNDAIFLTYMMSHGYTAWYYGSVTDSEDWISVPSC